MKQIILIALLSILVSCINSNQQKSNEVFSNIEINEKQVFSESNQNAPKIENSQEMSLISEFKNVQLYSLNDTIIADFNGDGINEKAIFVKKGETSGILIINESALDTIRIGFEKEFAHLTNFNWVDFWGLVKDLETFEIIFNETDIIGDSIVALENPSIVLRKEEAGGGVITYKNNEYVWIHQSD